MDIKFFKCLKNQGWWFLTKNIQKIIYIIIRIWKSHPSEIYNFFLHRINRMKNMLPQMAFEPTSPRLLSGVTTTTLPLLYHDNPAGYIAIRQCVDLNVDFQIGKIHVKINMHNNTHQIAKCLIWFCILFNWPTYLFL